MTVEVYTALCPEWGVGRNATDASSDCLISQPLGLSAGGRLDLVLRPEKGRPQHVGNFLQHPIHRGYARPPPLPEAPISTSAISPVRARPARRAAVLCSLHAPRLDPEATAFINARDRGHVAMNRTISPADPTRSHACRLRQLGRSAHSSLPIT